MINKLSKNLLEIYSGRVVLMILVRQYLTLRYRRTALGYLWTLVSPLLMMTVMAFVFSALQKVDTKTFAVFLFSGMIPWNCFNAITLQSSGVLINNEGLIKKVYIPKIIFPISIALGVLIDSVLSFLALAVIIVILGGTPSIVWLFIPIAFFLLFVFSLGVALIVSVSTVFFRDLQYLLAIIMQALFFLSPVLYKTNMLAGNIAWVVSLNPIVPFIDLFRFILHDGVLPDANVLIHSTVLSLLSVGLGGVFFLSQQAKIVFRL